MAFMAVSSKIWRSTPCRTFSLNIFNPASISSFSYITENKKGSWFAGNTKVWQVSRNILIKKMNCIDFYLQLSYDIFMQKRRNPMVQFQRSSTIGKPWRTNGNCTMGHTIPRHTHPWCRCPWPSRFNWSLDSLWYMVIVKLKYCHNLIDSLLIPIIKW